MVKIGLEYQLWSKHNLALVQVCSIETGSYLNKIQIRLTISISCMFHKFPKKIFRVCSKTFELSLDVFTQCLEKHIQISFIKQSCARKLTFECGRHYALCIFAHARTHSKKNHFRLKLKSIIQTSVSHMSLYSLP